MLKTVSSITNAIGALNYKGTWNASTNTPTLADGTGAKGDYYVVSTAGTQTFDGILLFFGAGDWIVYNGAVWQRVEGGSDGNFSNVTLNSTDAGATAGASTEKMIIGTTNLVINDIGAVFNVRIEGDTDANLFYTDATNSRVGVGTAGPTEKLDVVGGNIRIDNGNLVIGTSGKGIDFSITSHPAGMTSELLADYEEGTFTIAFAADSGTITLNAATMLYTKVGRLVTCTGYITVTSVSSPAGTLYFSGLPFTSNSASPTGITGFAVSGAGFGANAATQLFGYVDNNGTTGAIGGLTVTTGSNVPFAPYVNASTFLRLAIIYNAA